MDNPLKNRKIAITGGAGFIGHHLALELSSREADVAIIDGLQVNNLLSFSVLSKTPNNDLLYKRFIDQRLDMIREANVPLYVQDARDYHALSRLISEISPQVIVHLAAVSHAGRSNKDPYSTFDHSLRTLENALDASRDKVEHFIFFSSSMAYGNFLASEVDEEHSLDPLGIYGALKVAGEKIVIAYQRVFGLDYTIIRPSALYGPRCVSRRVGQIFIEKSMVEETLIIDGDGSDKLDFTYIDDLVSGVCLTIERSAARNQIFNMTYGASRSVFDLANLVREEFPEVKIQFRDRDHLKPTRGTLSIEKARTLLDYSPQNPLEVGLPKYIDWYREVTYNT